MSFSAHNKSVFNNGWGSHETIVQLIFGQLFKTFGRGLENEGFSFLGKAVNISGCEQQGGRKLAVDLDKWEFTFK